jgi:hypothetical protein
MNLALDYCCTDAEMNEAQSLNLHRQVGGGGPKWLSRVGFYAFAAVAAVLFYFRIKRDMAPHDRPWFIAIVLVVFIGVLVMKRFTRRKSSQTTRLEISECELVFTSDGGHTTVPWSAFSQCLESPTLFVLLDRSKQLLYTVPKRAFPDEAAQSWFRSLANQPGPVAPALVSETSFTGKLVAADGIALTLQLKYRDYLNRLCTSWRLKGIMLAILLFAVAGCLLASPPPDAVNSRGKTLMIMLMIMLPMFLLVFFVISLVSWRSDKTYVTPQHLALTNEGVEFASRDGSGLSPWKAYKYYLENRWSFFIWNPSGSVWLMFPKREFASRLDLDQCRELLQRNLRPSRWFFL